MIPINARRISGNWTEGWVLDYHTIASHYQKRSDRFDTMRTPLGEALYRYKYKYEWWLGRKLAATAVDFLRGEKLLSKIECIVIIPRRRLRLFFQPVRTLGRKIAKLLHIPVETRILKFKKRLPELKKIEDPRKRAILTKGMFAVRSTKLRGKTILLFDDLYRSGMTLSEGAGALQSDGEAGEIYVLAMTRTRTRR